MIADILTHITHYLSTSIWQYVFLAMYMVGAILISLYSLGQFHLLFIYIFKNKTYKRVAPLYAEKAWPKVTVQLPMFNELYVAQHVIDSCAQLDYPSDKLEIQILDDSTDETLQISQERAAFWQSKGIDVVVHHRTNREGFKAGALAEGTTIAKGDFIAIFDADFRPNPDFLKKTMGYFQDEKIGVVQGRWGHMNREYNLLTRAQSLLHDAFYFVEQQAREIGGFYLRFNGSAGIWRKASIIDAGGWSGDTLSEDYDLCLRAQIKGWGIVYDVNVEAPAELPVSMVDYKAQQYRWTKGRGQVIKKMFFPLLKAKLSPIVKYHAMFDMLNVFMLVGLFMLATTSIPIVIMLPGNETVQTVLSWFSLSLINVILAPWFAWFVTRAYAKTIWGRIKELIITFFPFAILLIGSSLFQLVSLIDGFFNKKSFFHRTSKYNAIDKSTTWKDKIYSPKEIPLVTWFEAVLALVVIGAIFIDFNMNSFGFLPFHVTLTLGFSFVFIQSLKRT